MEYPHNVQVVFSAARTRARPALVTRGIEKSLSLQFDTCDNMRRVDSAELFEGVLHRKRGRMKLRLAVVLAVAFMGFGVCSQAATNKESSQAPTPASVDVAPNAGTVVAPASKKSFHATPDDLYWLENGLLYLSGSNPAKVTTVQLTSNAAAVAGTRRSSVVSTVRLEDTTVLRNVIKAAPAGTQCGGFACKQGTLVADRLTPADDPTPVTELKTVRWVSNSNFSSAVGKYSRSFEKMIATFQAIVADNPKATIKEYGSLHFNGVVRSGFPAKVTVTHSGGDDWVVYVDKPDTEAEGSRAPTMLEIVGAEWKLISHQMDHPDNEPGEKYIVGSGQLP
jgi:hypothetical protein